MSDTTTEASPPATTHARTIEQLRGMGKTIAREAGGATVKQFFEANRDTIAAVLPKHMTPDRMLALALRCLRTTPKLMGCTLASLFGAVITCAQLGLEPNTPLGHIFLIPFENKKKRIVEVQIIIGYKGMLNLARRSGEIESISARVVYAGDTFELEYGTDDRVVHKPKLDGDAGEILGFYSVARLKGGGVQFEWMSRHQVDRIRDASQNYLSAAFFAKKDGTANKSPWATSYDEMGRKTTIRRLSKYLPMSLELAGAVSLDERGERGMQDMGAVLDGIDYTVEPEEAEADEPGTAQVTHEQTVSLDLNRVTEREPVQTAPGAEEKPKRARQARATEDKKQPAKAPEPTLLEQAPDEGDPGQDTGGFGSGE